MGYEATRVLFKAIETAGTLDKTKVRDAIATTNLSPSMVVGNKITFAATGQIDNPYIITQNLPNGKIAIIYPKDLANGTAIVPVPK
jgi:ABC-type branched-subunit amino acid transport system substrate-binding protein